MSTMGSSLRVLLYIKPGCHLCEQAEADLARLRRRQPHTLVLVDLTSDAELMHRYGLRIPVVSAGRREYDAPLDAALLAEALAAAALATFAAADAEVPASSTEPQTTTGPHASAGSASAIGARPHGN